MASGGTGDVLAGTIGALLAQGLAPYDAARLGVYLHGLAGDAVRERIGDAGLLARGSPRRDPAGSQPARRDRGARSAPDAGSGSERATSRPGRDPPAPGTPGEGSGGRARDPLPARPTIEDRLRRPASPRCPRTAWLELDLDALRGNLAVLREIVGPRRAGRAGGQGGRLRPRGRPGGPCARGGRRRWALRGHGGRGVRAARGRGRAAPARLCTRCRRHASRSRRRAARIAVSVGPGCSWSASSPRPRGPPPWSRPGRRSRSTSRSRPGSGAAASCRDEAVAAIRSRGRDARASAWRGAWTHLAAPDDHADAARPGRAVRRRALELAGSMRVGWRPDAARRHLAGSGGVLAVDVGSLGRGPHRALDLRPRARTRWSLPAETAGRGVAPAAGHGAPGATGAGRGPAGGPRRELRAVVRDRATVADRDPPGRLRRRLAAVLSDRPTALVRGVRVPLVGRVTMDAVMADVTDVPGPAGHRGRRVRAAGRAGRRAITALDLASTAGTISYEIVTAMSRRLPRVYHAAGSPVEDPDARGWEVRVARIELWNGDICDLEVDAIVSPASTSLWMSTAIAGELKRIGGRRDRVRGRSATRPPTSATRSSPRPARLAARVVIHAVSLERDRRTSGPAIDRAARSAMARARELGLSSIAFPALGTGIGGFPLDEAARIAVEAVRDELATPSTIEHVIFALRGAAAYEAFAHALPRATRPRRGRCSRRCQRAGRGRPPRPATTAPGIGLPAGPGDREPSGPSPADELPHRAARRAARGPRRGRRARDPAARPHRPGRPLPRGQPPVPARWARPRCCSSIPCCASCSAARLPSASELLRDDVGIEALIDRLEELDESDGWDA